MVSIGRVTLPFFRPMRAEPVYLLSEPCCRRGIPGCCFPVTNVKMNNHCRLWVIVRQAGGTETCTWRQRRPMTHTSGTRLITALRSSTTWWNRVLADTAATGLSGSWRNAPWSTGASPPKTSFTRGGKAGYRFLLPATPGAWVAFLSSRRNAVLLLRPG